MPVFDYNNNQLKLNKKSDFNSSKGAKGVARLKGFKNINEFLCGISITNVAASCATLFTCVTRTMGHGDDSYNHAVPLAPSTLFTMILEHSRSHKN